MSLISNTEAEEIRGKVCEDHGAVWIHHYHSYIERALIRKLKQSLGREFEALINKVPQVEWLPADDSEGGLT